MHKIEIN